MTLAEFVAVLRHRWPWVAVPLLVSVSLAGLVSAMTEPTYRATASTYFSLPTGESANDLFQGSNFTQQQMGSFAALATQPIVLEPVIGALDLDVTPRELARNLEVVPAADSVIIDVTAVSEDRLVAAEIANAVTEELREAVRVVSPLLPDGEPAVRAVTVAEAEPPTQPSSPQTRRNLLAGALAGLLAGLLAALARDKLDTRIRGKDDLPADVALLTQVAHDPTYRAARRSGSERARRRAMVRSESFRKLRTSLRFLTVDSPIRSVVVTSSLAGEGKTTTALHLGRVLAEEGRRVLVVDADMRRPSVAAYLALEGGIGLADVLSGSVSLEDATQSVAVDGMHVLPSGSVPPNPSELLGSRAMSELLLRLRSAYDHVVIDAPPVLPVTDALVAAAHSDGVVLVVRRGKTRHKDLESSLDALRGVETRLLGVVLNRTPGARAFRSGRDYYHYY